MIPNRTSPLINPKPSLLQTALSDKGIVPSDTKRYRHDDVADAIEDAFGVGARLHCDGNGQLTEVRRRGTFSHPTLILHAPHFPLTRSHTPTQVWMCISRDLKPMACPGSDNQQCRDVSIPRLPSAEAFSGAGDKESVPREEVRGVEQSVADY